MSKKKTYSNYEIDRLKKDLIELSKFTFKQILIKSEFDNFLDQDTFENHQSILRISSNTINKLEEFLESMKTNQ